jgi:hypothetical protein
VSTKRKTKTGRERREQQQKIAHQRKAAPKPKSSIGFIISIITANCLLLFTLPVVSYIGAMEPMDGSDEEFMALVIWYGMAAILLVASVYMVYKDPSGESYRGGAGYRGSGE